MFPLCHLHGRRGSFVSLFRLSHPVLVPETGFVVPKPAGKLGVGGAARQEVVVDAFWWRHFREQPALLRDLQVLLVALMSDLVAVQENRVPQQAALVDYQHALLLQVVLVHERAVGLILQKLLLAEKFKLAKPSNTIRSSLPENPAG